MGVYMTGKLAGGPAYGRIGRVVWRKRDGL